MAKIISILIAGKAGQGISSVEMLLTKGFKRTGLYTYATKEYMSRIRGGSNSTLIMVSDAPVNAPVFTVDIAIPLDHNAFGHIQDRIGPQTLLIVPNNEYECVCERMVCDLEEMAKKLGNPLVSNTIAAGMVFALLGVEKAPLEAIIKDKFASSLLQSNLDALDAGEKLITQLGGCRYCITPDMNQYVKEYYFLSGTEAVGFGAIAGGCAFVSSYPMSPSTGVLTFLAQKGGSIGICVEQAEDEIAAFQMALGVWYGGGRAMTTTSGGGFALMGEGISLSGMTETPMVVYLAQRPGPATGLPTRTEQADLELAVYAGHGEFPIIVLAPGDVLECFECARDAFELADRYQTPVIILSDQYLADTYSTVEAIKMPKEVTPSITKTEANYRRYALSESGISPRGIPGFGEGIVLADSDEHTEEGLITESMQERVRQNEKRLSKIDGIRMEAIVPSVMAPIEIAVVGWGSTKHIIQSALMRLNNPRIGAVHFSWVHPLSSGQLETLHKAKRIVVVENNATGQFAKQLRLAGIAVDRQILRYDGLSFFADELEQEIASIVKEWL